MNLRNIVYDFLTTEIANIANTAIFGATLHADRYEEPKEADGNSWIRLDNIKRYETNALNGSIRQINAPVEIQIIVRPASQLNIDRRAAEEKVNAMAMQLTQLFYDNERLRDTTGSTCNVGVIGGLEEWLKIGNVRHAAGYVVLVINPVKTS